MDNPTNRNLTNGQIQLNIDEEDRLPAGQKFTTSWQLEDSQNEDIALAKTTTFLESTSPLNQTSAQESSLRFQTTISSGMKR